MILKRNLIHYLLILCIGLVPAIGLGAGGMQHMDHGSAGCPGCEHMEMTPDSTCDSGACLAATHTCGANLAAGLIPQPASSLDGYLLQTVVRTAGDSGPGSHWPESIYRPPIS